MEKHLFHKTHFSSFSAHSYSIQQGGKTFCENIFFVANFTVRKKIETFSKLRAIVASPNDEKYFAKIFRSYLIEKFAFCWASSGRSRNQFAGSFFSNRCKYSRGETPCIVTPTEDISLLSKNIWNEIRSDCLIPFCINTVFRRIE